MSEIDAEIDHARDVALRAVTAALHGDNSGRLEELEEALDEGMEPLTLAMVLTDLVAHIHSRWATSLNAPALEGWQAMAADVAEWRATTAGGPGHGRP